MIIFLLVSQTLYVCSLAGWLLVWGMSFMVFDNGIHLWNTLFFAGVSAYPLAVITCSATAWILRNRRKRIAAAVGLVPFLWIAAYAILMLAY
ncbi:MULTISPECIES: hypothetical protein [Paenibacillus]|uniref:hypothetical protein n=1 Tax=Paenibacillus TaxID=44249 RepID=UPI0022B9028F|nr:hypothetical protein [Paenibacillus caseinilyticus]MCZ8520953.1 hypothetical protein [Paenibacillus caseinilyticus]